MRHHFSPNCPESSRDQALIPVPAPPHRSALRTALQADLTPEQLTVLFQGTAGLYQDLRMELMRQMQAFEEYALEEILKVPVGLLPDVPGAENAAVPEVSPEEEAAVEAQLKELRAAIAASKRKARDMQTAAAALERAMAGARDRLARLEAVPGALAGKENVTEEARALAERGAAVEASCAALGVRVGGAAGGSGPAPPAGEADGTDTVPPEEMTGKQFLSFHAFSYRLFRRR